MGSLSSERAPSSDRGGLNALNFYSIRSTVGPCILRRPFLLRRRFNMAYNLRGRRSGASDRAGRTSDALAAELAASLAIDDGADDDSFALVPAATTASRQSPIGESASLRLPPRPVRAGRDSSSKLAGLVPALA